MIGIEPGGTTTRSATRTLCDSEIADVTFRLMLCSRSRASSSEPPRFLSSTIATSCSLRMVRDGDRRGATSGDLLDRRLDVIGVVVTPIHDQQIFDSADEEQLAVGDDAQIAGPKPGALRRAGRWIDEPSTERPLRQLRVSPVAGGDVVAVHPDLPDLVGRFLDARLGIDDPHGAGARSAEADKLRTGLFPPAALRVAGRQLLVVETDGCRGAARVRRRHIHHRLGQPVRRLERGVREVVAARTAL